MSARFTPRQQLAWLMYCYQQGYTSPDDRAGLENWMADDPATLTDNDVRTQRGLLGMADEILATMDAARAGGTMAGTEEVVMFQAGNTAAGITANVQRTLVNLRNALADAQQAQLWAESVSMADLITAGFEPDPEDESTSPDAQDIKSALADAAAFAQIFDTGQAPGSYPQVSDPYVYGQSIRNIIGPRAS